MGRTRSRSTVVHSLCTYHFAAGRHYQSNGLAVREWPRRLQYALAQSILELPADVILFTAWLFELAGGALTDYEDTCIPKSQREVAFTVAALHQWDMGVLDDRCRETAEEWVSGTLLPVNSGGPFPGVSICSHNLSLPRC